MGATRTDAETKHEIEEGQSLREHLEESVEEDIEQLNNAQIQRLDSLKEFIAEGFVEVRVINPEDGIFHAKGAAFRAPPDEDGNRPGATVVGSSNFSYSGHTQNVELNLTSQEEKQVEAFEDGSTASGQTPRSSAKSSSR